MVDFAPYWGRNKMTRSTLIACALLLSIAAANAETLTPEQQAIVKKYHISAADQKKLFGSAPAPVSPAKAGRPGRADVAASGGPNWPNSPANRTDNWHRGLLNNTYVWLGGETYKSIGERLTNINGGTGSLTGSFGAVGGINTSFGIDEFPIRLQAGASYGVYDFRGRLAIVPQSTETEKQTVYTVGLYHRGDALGGNFLSPFSVGVVYDTFRATDWGINANNIHLAQFRGMAGYALTPWTEIGVSGTTPSGHDQAAITVAGAPGLLTTIHAMSQRNVYLKQHFDFGGDLTVYGGSLVQGIGSYHVGMMGQAPLGPYWSVLANINYVMPHTPAGPLGSGQEQFSASFSLAHYFGGNAAAPTVSGYKNLPLLPVANNGSFLITD